MRTIESVMKDETEHSRFELHVLTEVARQFPELPECQRSRLVERHPAGPTHYANSRTQTRWEGWVAHALYCEAHKEPDHGHEAAS